MGKVNNLILSYLKSEYLFVYSIILFRGLAMGSLGPILPLYLRSVGISIQNYSLLLSLSFLGMTLMETVWGFLSDKIGVEKILIFAFFGLFFITLGYNLSTDLFYLMVLRFLSGLIGISQAPSCKILVADTFSSKDMGKAMGFYVTILSLGSIIGTIINSYVAKFLGYNASIYLSAFIILIPGIIILNKIKLDIRKIKLNFTIPRFNLNLSAVFKEIGMIDSKFFILFIMQMFSTAGLGIISQYLPIIISEYFNSSVITVGYIITIKKIAELILSPFSGRLSDRFGRFPLIMSGYSIMLIFGFLSLYISNLLHLTLIVIGMSFGTAIEGPAILALLTDISPIKSRGTIQGMHGAFQDLGILISPLIANFVWNNYLPIFIFPIAGFIQIFSLILALRFKKIFLNYRN